MHAPDHTARSNSSDSLSLDLADEAATKSFGAALGAVLQVGDVVTLEGDLGAGKTTLVRGLLEGLGYTGKVKSPTYALVEPHAVSGLNLYHFDFYRLNQPEEYLEAGLDEYFSGQGICLVEWPDKAAPYLPEPDLRVELAVLGDGRKARLQAVSQRGRACLSAFTQAHPPR
ncbi:MAG TPA: tRNA (adenosine(37)-N6)-threonylcarbamoyltransferase complex ATPase subunit type 1 TsaE [Rhodocyclaceae bacterium]|nr:tRNA (adenosine(37)-N6)-threonylcarbamoyltransferase complex ATPase subunit type 1 TsaE [Rhodocyclaceae bacterium]